MKVLIVDCWGKSSRGRIRAKELHALVQSRVGWCDSRVVIDQVNYKDGSMDRYLWTQKGCFGLDPNVIFAVASLFKEYDADGSGSIDEGELFSLICQLLGKLGESRPDLYDWIQEEVGKSMSTYDSSGNRMLELDELVEMLTHEPWNKILPAGNAHKDAANNCMRNFCLLDLVIVDGDPNQLPWDPEMRDLLQLVWQITYAQRWTEGKPSISLLCSSVGTQMLAYLSSMGPKCLDVYGGSHGHKGTARVDSIDKEVAKKRKLVFLDNSKGNCLQVHEATGEWRKVGNTCLVLNASRTRAKTYKPKDAPQEGSGTTIVKRSTQHYKHWLFDGNPNPTLVAGLERGWDLEMVGEAASKVQVLASSTRGPEIICTAGCNIGTLFSFSRHFVRTCDLVESMLRHVYAECAHRVLHDVKDGLHVYMVVQGGLNELNIELPPCATSSEPPADATIPPVALPDYRLDGTRASSSRPSVLLLNNQGDDPHDGRIHEHHTPHAPIALDTVQIPLSQYSNTALNPVSEALSPTGNNQSLRSSAEECFLGYSQLVSQRPETELRPRTTAASIRPLSMANTHRAGTGIPRRRLVVPLGIGDSVAFNTLPATSYRTHRELPLPPTKYEEDACDFAVRRVRSISPDGRRPFCNFERMQSREANPSLTLTPKCDVTEEAAWRLHEKQVRAESIGFPRMRVRTAQSSERPLSGPHYLAVTDPKIAMSNLFAGGQFERSLRPSEQERWKRRNSKKIPIDFKRYQPCKRAYVGIGADAMPISRVSGHSFKKYNK